MHGRTYMDLAVMEGLCLSATNRAELQKPDLVSSWCIGLSQVFPEGFRQRPVWPTAAAPWLWKVPDVCRPC